MAAAASRDLKKAQAYVEEKIGAVVEKYAVVAQRCDTHLSVMRNPSVADSDVAEVVVFCKGEVVRAEERSPSMWRRRAEISPTHRGAAAGAARIVRGDASPPRMPRG